MTWVAVLWCWFEFARFLTPPAAQLALSIVLFAWWLSQPRKAWSRTDAAWGVLVGGVALGIPFSANYYEALMSAKFFLLTVLGVCLPLQTLISSVSRARLLVLGFAITAAFVGAWATSHGGYGPAAAAGQDENYVATLVVAGAGVSYFLLFSEKRAALRLALAGSILLALGALALAGNPSRGGFLALIAVGLYALYRSPRKAIAIGTLAVASVALLVVAGDAFWKEIATTSDYSSGTGDMRLEIWKIGFRMWLANPIFGVGAGNFKWVVGDYQSAEQLAKFGRSLGGSIVAHSFHVELLAELGAVGTIATWALIVSTWRGLGGMLIPAARARQANFPRELKALSCYADAIRAAMIAVLVSGLFLSLLYYSHLWVLLAIGTGLRQTHRRELQRLAQTSP